MHASGRNAARARSCCFIFRERLWTGRHWRRRMWIAKKTALRHSLVRRDYVQRSTSTIPLPVSLHPGPSPGRWKLQGSLFSKREITDTESRSGFTSNWESPALSVIFRGPRDAIASQLTGPPLGSFRGEEFNKIDAIKAAEGSGIGSHLDLKPTLARPGHARMTDIQQSFEGAPTLVVQGGGRVCARIVTGFPMSYRARSRDPRSTQVRTYRRRGLCQAQRGLRRMNCCSYMNPPPTGHPRHDTSPTPNKQISIPPPGR